MMEPKTKKNNKNATDADEAESSDSAPTETGGREGLDPTRYGDWEHKGRAVDF